MSIDQPTWSANLVHHKWRGRSPVYDYNSAATWLKGAKSVFKSERTLYEGRHIRLIRLDSNNIAVRLEHYDWRSRTSRLVNIITYRSDGVTFIDCGGRLPAQHMRNILMKYVPGLQVVQRKYRSVLSLPIHTKTAPKLIECNRCDGNGWVPGQCYTSGRCWNPFECKRDDHVEEMPASGGEPISMHPCEHGQTSYHEDLSNPHACWRCGGTGKRDIGSKMTGVVWDCERIGLDAGYQFVEA